jgi:hypothetical protein
MQSGYQSFDGKFWQYILNKCGVNIFRNFGEHTATQLQAVLETQTLGTGLLTFLKES